MRVMEQMMRLTTHLNIGALIAVVLWVIWIAAITASPGWADPAPSVTILKPCACSHHGNTTVVARRT